MAVLTGRRLEGYDARALAVRATETNEEKIMKLIRACFLVLAVLLPTSWTIARAADAPPAGAETKKEKKAKKSKKKEGGDMGDMKKDDMEKK